LISFPLKGDCDSLELGDTVSKMGLDSISFLFWICFSSYAEIGIEMVYFHRC
jgi:hypothetical protein